MYVTVRDTVAAPAPSAAVVLEDHRGRRVAPVVITLGLVSMLTDISSESVSAILPLYLTTVLGLSAVAYGLVDALYQGVSALVRMLGGWAADRGGHPKWVAFAGYGLSCVARLGLLVTAGLGVVTAVVTADRIGKGLRTAPRDAMIAAATEPAHLGRAFGVHRSMDTAGAVAGPLLAFGLLWWVPDGFRLVMVVSFGFALVGVALLGLLVPDRTPVDRRPALHPDPVDAPRFGWRLLATPGLRRLLLVAGMLGLLTVGDGFLYLALLDRGGFAVHWFPLMYVGTNVAYLVLAVPLGRLADRVGRARVLVGGHVALLAAYLCATGPGTATTAVVGTLVLLGTFYAATDGVTAALAGRIIPVAARASGIAAAQTAVAVSRMGSSAVFGLLWFTIGPHRALLLVAALLAVAIPVGATQLLRLDRPDPRQGALA